MARPLEDLKYFNQGRAMNRIIVNASNRLKCAPVHDDGFEWSARFGLNTASMTPEEAHRWLASIAALLVEPAPDLPGARSVGGPEGQLMAGFARYIAPNPPGCPDSDCSAQARKLRGQPLRPNQFLLDLDLEPRLQWRYFLAALACCENRFQVEGTPVFEPNDAATRHSIREWVSGAKMVRDAAGDRLLNMTWTIRALGSHKDQNPVLEFVRFFCAVLEAAGCLFDLKVIFDKLSDLAPEGYDAFRTAKDRIPKHVGMRVCNLAEGLGTSIGYATAIQLLEAQLALADGDGDQGGPPNGPNLDVDSSANVNVRQGGETEGSEEPTDLPREQHASEGTDVDSNTQSAGLAAYDLYEHLELLDVSIHERDEAERTATRDFLRVFRADARKAGANPDAMTKVLEDQLRAITRRHPSDKLARRALRLVEESQSRPSSVVSVLLSMFRGPGLFVTLAGATAIFVFLIVRPTNLSLRSKSPSETIAVRVRIGDAVCPPHELTVEPRVCRLEPEDTIQVEITNFDALYEIRATVAANGEEAKTILPLEGGWSSLETVDSKLCVEGWCPALTTVTLDAPPGPASLSVEVRTSAADSVEFTFELDVQSP